MNPRDPRDTRSPIVCEPCMGPACEQRTQAIIDERLLPSKSRGGWILLDAPKRRVSDDAWKRLFDAGLRGRGGEYYIFITCPFCGGELPAPTEEGLPDTGEGAEA